MTLIRPPGDGVAPLPAADRHGSTSGVVNVLNEALP